MSPLSLEKICYFPRTIKCVGQLICLCASLHERNHVDLTGKPSLKFNKTINKFITVAIVIKQVEVLFPIKETIVRSIITYRKLRPSL